MWEEREGGGARYVVVRFPSARARASGNLRIVVVIFFYQVGSLAKLLLTHSNCTGAFVYLAQGRGPARFEASSSKSRQTWQTAHALTNDANEMFPPPPGKGPSPSHPPAGVLIPAGLGPPPHKADRRDSYSRTCRGDAFVRASDREVCRSFPYPSSVSLPHPLARETRDERSLATL